MADEQPIFAGNSFMNATSSYVLLVSCFSGTAFHIQSAGCCLIAMLITCSVNNGCIGSKQYTHMAAQMKASKRYINSVYMFLQNGESKLVTVATHSLKPAFIYVAQYMYHKIYMW